MASAGRLLQPRPGTAIVCRHAETGRCAHPARHPVTRAPAPAGASGRSDRKSPASGPRPSCVLPASPGPAARRPAPPSRAPRHHLSRRHHRQKEQADRRAAPLARELGFRIVPIPKTTAYSLKVSTWSSVIPSRREKEDRAVLLIAKRLSQRPASCSFAASAITRRALVTGS